MRFRIEYLLCLLALVAPSKSAGQSSLSQNSGINGADTWIVADLTMSASDTVTLPSQVYLSSTGTWSNTVSGNAPTITMHVESGYDSNGGVVMNIWPNGPSLYAFGAAGGTGGVIRYAGGEMTVFDQNGNVVTPTPPAANVSPGWPLGFLGTNPGPTAVRNVVVPNIQAHASALGASLSISGSTATVSIPYPSGTTAVWSYVQTGTNRIAQSVTVTPAMENISAPHTIQFANVNWNDNSANDLARARAGSTLKAFPSHVASSPGSLLTPQADAPLTPTSTTFTTSNCNSNVYPSGGPQNVLFMHGWTSNSCAWTIMANWLNNDFRFGTEVIPSLDTGDGIAVMGEDLVGEVNSVGGSNYILIGHSMGGLASRYAAQYFQSLKLPTSVVNGVVTVDTPHEGANMAQSLQSITTIAFVYVGVSLWDSLGCDLSTDNAGCYLAALLAGAAPYTTNAIYSATNSSVIDLSPGSPALNNLNSDVLTGGAPESFNQAAIIGFTPWQWSEVRWLDNFITGKLGCGGPTEYCCLPKDPCGEENVSAAVGYFYDALLFSFGFLEFEEWVYCEEFDSGDPNCVAPPFLQQEADQLLQWIAYMEFADLLWNVAVDFPDNTQYAGSSDALVQASSQFYPASTATQYPIYGSDSHSGSIKSQTDHQVLYNILAGSPFNVPTQATCSFAVSNSPAGFSGNGGTGSVTLTTGAGCNWSATSLATWLSINSGVNGASSGTIGFSVAPNPGSTPIVGTIQVGNGLSSALFTVNEGAACYYNLSEDPIVAVSPSGGTGTIQVTASSIDCPWVAVSNASWLTITAGATGTGSGSFTWAASPNTGTSDRTATVNVMNLTLTFVDGSSVDTPGAGTVTIQGTEQSAHWLMMPCGNLPKCPETTYESGAVTVTVDGESFSAGYSNTSATASSLASALASQMNYPLSPISATVSGATIYITSSLNGAGTNYPLLRSATFTPGSCPDGLVPQQCFSSPAFTASASGPNLTGGTD
ncbi:MAG: BACON domain-containing protein [Terracidiphilus sp.]